MFFDIFFFIMYVLFFFFYDIRLYREDLLFFLYRNIKLEEVFRYVWLKEVLG